MTVDAIFDTECSARLTDVMYFVQAVSFKQMSTSAHYLDSVEKSVISNKSLFTYPT